MASFVACILPSAFWRGILGCKKRREGLYRTRNAKRNKNCSFPKRRKKRASSILAPGQEEGKLKRGVQALKGEVDVGSPAGSRGAALV